MPSYPPVPCEMGYAFARRHTDTYPEIDALTKSNHSGKSVLVTGASRGIGLATAVSYALAGVSQLAISARSGLGEATANIKARCEKAGKPAPKILEIIMNVSDEKSVSAAAKVVEAEFGRLDILYNNAGAIDTFESIIDSDPIRWWRLHEVNVLGVYLCTRAFLPLMLRGGDKTIVNTSSIGAHALMAGASGYQISKLGVLRFSEFVMAEYADQSVLCFSIHPGGVKTDMADFMTDEFNSHLSDTPELAADSIVFLTQTKRDWLAGRYIDLTWDVPELLSREKEIVEKDSLKVKLVV